MDFLDGILGLKHFLDEKAFFVDGRALKIVCLRKTVRLGSRMLLIRNILILMRGSNVDGEVNAQGWYAERG